MRLLFLQDVIRSRTEQHMYIRDLNLATRIQYGRNPQRLIVALEQSKYVGIQSIAEKEYYWNYNH